MTRLSTPLSILYHALIQLKEARPIYSRIKITRMCMKALNRSIWLSSISLQTKIKLYNAYMLPILVQTRGVYDVHLQSTMLLTDDASVISCSFYIEHWMSTRHKRRSKMKDLATASHSSHYDTAAFIPPHCSILPITVPLTCSQPSSVSRRSGIAREVDQDEPGFERLTSTSSNTHVTTRRRSERRTVSGGDISWRWLCPAKDALLDQW